MPEHPVGNAGEDSNGGELSRFEAFEKALCSSKHGGQKTGKGDFRNGILRSVGLSESRVRCDIASASGRGASQLSYSDRRPG